MWMSTCVYEPELRALAQALLEHGVLTGTQAKEVVAAATAEKLVGARPAPGTGAHTNECVRTRMNANNLIRTRTQASH